MNSAINSKLILRIATNIFVEYRSKQIVPLRYFVTFNFDLMKVTIQGCEKDICL